MNPAFRVLTRWTASTDAAFYDTFQKPQRESYWTEGIISLITSGYLLLQIFVWGVRAIEAWSAILSLACILALILTLRSIYVRTHRRERYLKEKAAKRKEKMGSSDMLTAVLFFDDYLVQYDMLTGKSLRVDYDEIKRIRVSTGYYFLMLRKSKEIICLEKEGFSGKLPHNAVKWLAARCRCRFRK